MKKLKKALFTIPTIIAAGAISASNNNDEAAKLSQKLKKAS